MRSRATVARRLSALALAALVLPLSPPAAADVGPTDGLGPGAPGPLPNGTLPNGSLPNGTLPNGTLPNGTLPNGSLPNGSLPNGTLPSLGVPEFEDHTQAAGLAAVTASRVAWGDYDNDGWDDIMFAGGRLFHNNRDGTFSDVALPSGTQGPYTGGVWGDYNNDGWLDYYATAWREQWDTLLRNNGDGTFTNVTVAAGGVYDDLPSEAAAWGDYDNDGCLDLFVVNYEWPPLDNVTDSFGTPNILWRNNCDGTFENATSAAGVLEFRRSRGAVWTDFNHDGWLDLYVSNYRLEPNELWQNRGNGTFTNVAPARGVDCDNRTGTNPAGVCGHSIGTDVADYNNDGALDMFVANLNHPRLVPSGGDFSALYRNGGAPDYDFTNMRSVVGIGYCETASNPTWGDFDADGDMDLFVTSIYEGRGNNLYRNDALLGFTEVTDRARVASDNGWGAAWSDFDNDGDLDLLVGSSSGAKLWRNPGNDNGWIELTLHGLHSNRAGIGARVTVTSGRDAQVQEVQGGEGTASQSSLRLFFGLGPSAAPVSVMVEWPSGLTQELQFAPNAAYRVDEPEGTHDLAVRSLALEPRSPVVNSQVFANAVIENVGQIPADSATVVFYRGSVAPANRMAAVSVDRFTGTRNVTATLTAPSSPGPFTVIAALEDQQPSDVDPSNDQRADSVAVRARNEPPAAALNATPLTVTVGRPVRFDGSASTDDTGILQYIFAFGDGEALNGSDPEAEHNYSAPGSYIARLTVIDEDGEPSTNDASLAISVTAEGAVPPVAVIDAIRPPSPSMLGTSVTFEGHGESAGSTIAEYEWGSDIEGILSHDPVFQTSDLSLGNHRITLRVRDAEGAWSEPAATSYLVVGGGSVDLRIRDIVNSSVLRGLVVVRGTAVAPAGVGIVTVEWRVDGGNHRSAQGAEEWSFPLNTTDFSEGPHDLTVRAIDSTGLVTERTVHVVFSQSAAPPPPGMNLTAALLIAGSAAALAAAGALLWSVRGRRRRAARAPHSPPPAPGRRPRPVKRPAVGPAAPRLGGTGARTAEGRVSAKAVASRSVYGPPPAAESPQGPLQHSP